MTAAQMKDNLFLVEFIRKQDEQIASLTLKVEELTAILEEAKKASTKHLGTEKG